MSNFPKIYTLKSTGQHYLFYSADEVIPLSMEDRVTELEVVGYPCSHENWEEFHQKKGEYPFMYRDDSADLVLIKEGQHITVEKDTNEIWYCNV